MTVRIAVSSQSRAEDRELELDGKKIEVMRGRSEAVELRELVESLKEEVSGHLDEPCEVKLELSGATTIHGGGGAKLLILNIEGGVEKTSGMKIALTFKIAPQR